MNADFESEKGKPQHANANHYPVTGILIGEMFNGTPIEYRKGQIRIPVGHEPENFGGEEISSQDFFLKHLSAAAIAELALSDVDLNLLKGGEGLTFRPGKIDRGKWEDLIKILRENQERHQRDKEKELDENERKRIDLPTFGKLSEKETQELIDWTFDALRYES